MLNYLIRNYLLLLIQHTITLTFSYVATIFPNWLQFRAPEPLGFKTKYGLFKQCSMLTEQCRAFPDPAKGDCDEAGFCKWWYIARYSELLAVVIGTVVWLGLIYLVFAPRLRQSKAWPVVLTGLVTFAGLQVMAMSSMAYLFNWSSEFYVGTNYDFSFYLNLASWVLGLVGAGMLGATIMRSGDGYNEIQ